MRMVLRFQAENNVSFPIYTLYNLPYTGKFLRQIFANHLLEAILRNLFLQIIIYSSLLLTVILFNLRNLHKYSVAKISRYTVFCFYFSVKKISVKGHSCLTNVVMISVIDICMYCTYMYLSYTNIYMYFLLYSVSLKVQILNTLDNFPFYNPILVIHIHMYMLSVHVVILHSLYICIHVQYMYIFLYICIVV